MESVSNKYIDNSLKDLASKFGFKDFVLEGKIAQLLLKNRTAEAIGLIANAYGLPVKVNLYDLKLGERDAKQYWKNSTFINNGTSNVAARVMIPDDLPVYGTSRMINFPISISLTDQASVEPLTFITIIAHELAHIFLFSLRHPNRESEVFTDLTAMAMGFSRVMEKGRKTIKTSVNSNAYGNIIQTSTTTYGYLSDESFEYANNQINKIISSQKDKKFIQQGSLHILDSELDSLSSRLALIENLLKEVDVKKIAKISTAENIRLSELYRPDYIPKHKETILNQKKQLAKFLETLNRISGYSTENESVLNDISFFSHDVEFKNLSQLIHNDYDVLIKHLKFKAKTKIFLRKFSINFLKT